MAVAQGHGLDAIGSRITARIGIGPTGHGGFGIEAARDSNAIRYNVQVTLTVDGIPVARTAA
jgi:hypothetical protein